MRLTDAKTIFNHEAENICDPHDIKTWRFDLSHMLDSPFEAGFVHSIPTIFIRIVPSVVSVIGL